jgi:FAD/FMN-containing dehydrogenase
MTIKTKTFYDLATLESHLKTHIPSFYFGAKTSTVIPYDKIESLLKPQGEYYLCDLSQMPKSMELTPDGHLKVRGAISWKEANDYLKPLGRSIMTSPTEELAHILSGLATSCTGERCFAFGNLRGQVLKVTYLDYNGNEQTLNVNDQFQSIEGLRAYQEEFKPFENFKNAPFPRFQSAIDLMIGTEGQLGVIIEATIKTVANSPLNHLFIKLPRWEENYLPHLEINQLIQNFRKEVYVCEMIDSNGFSFLAPENRPIENGDAIFFEIESEKFEYFYENFIGKLKLTQEENIFELTESKFHQIRASVPRAVFEENSRMGVTKMGTDVQVRVSDFSKLLDIYREFSKKGIRYNLFGHFGDCHLHFNFMPKPQDIPLCQSEFEKLYEQVLKLNGSPFAEHGIGLIKQKYIKKFHSCVQKTLFKELKSKHDPHNQFFPQGFMSI